MAAHDVMWDKTCHGDNDRHSGSMSQACWKHAAKTSGQCVFCAVPYQTVLAKRSYVCAEHWPLFLEQTWGPGSRCCEGEQCRAARAMAVQKKAQFLASQAAQPLPQVSIGVPGPPPAPTYSAPVPLPRGPRPALPSPAPVPLPSGPPGFHGEPEAASSTDMAASSSCAANPWWSMVQANASQGTTSQQMLLGKGNPAAAPFEGHVQPSTCCTGVQTQAPVPVQTHAATQTSSEVVVAQPTAPQAATAIQAPEPYVLAASSSPCASYMQIKRKLDNELVYKFSERQRFQQAPVITSIRSPMRVCTSEWAAPGHGGSLPVQPTQSRPTRAQRPYSYNDTCGIDVDEAFIEFVGDDLRHKAAQVIAKKGGWDLP